MVDQITQRIFQHMFVRQLAVVRHAFPQVTMVYRSLLERPFIAVRHNKHHGFATTCRYQRFQRVYRIAFILP